MRIIGDDMRKAQQAKANVLEVKSEQVVTEAVAVKVCVWGEEGAGNSVAGYC
jgi:hypothetical protein